MMQVTFIYLYVHSKTTTKEMQLSIYMFLKVLQLN